jgi:hypothetical protein
MRGAPRGTGVAPPARAGALITRKGLTALRFRYPIGGGGGRAGLCFPTRKDRAARQ